MCGVWCLPINVIVLEFSYSDTTVKAYLQVWNKGEQSSKPQLSSDL